MILVPPNIQVSVDPFVTMGSVIKARGNGGIHGADVTGAKEKRKQYIWGGNVHLRIVTPQTMGRHKKQAYLSRNGRMN